MFILNERWQYFDVIQMSVDHKLVLSLLLMKFTVQSKFMTLGVIGVGVLGSFVHFP